MLCNFCDISISGYTRMTEGGVILDPPIPEDVPKHTISLSQQEFVDLIFSSQPWRRYNAGGGMVCKHVYKASCLKWLRFLPDRNIIEDEFFSLKTALIAGKVSFIPDILYFYRKTPNSLSQHSQFNLRLSKGRELCLLLVKNFPLNIELRIQTAYINSLIKSIKSSALKPDLDLSSYKKTVQKARKNKMIGFKNFLLFMLFCDHKFLSKIYMFGKKLFANQTAHKI